MISPPWTLPEGFASLGSIVFVQTVFDADTGFGMSSGTRFGRDPAFASPAIQLGEIPGRAGVAATFFGIRAFLMAGLWEWRADGPSQRRFRTLRAQT